MYKETRVLKLVVKEKPKVLVIQVGIRSVQL